MQAALPDSRAYSSGSYTHMSDILTCDSSSISVKPDSVRHIVTAVRTVRLTKVPKQQ